MIGIAGAVVLGGVIAAPLLAVQQRNQLRDVVEFHLRDPASAEYRGDRLHRTEHGLYYCGLVNARNAFGGYTGYRRFVASGQDVAFEPHPGDPTRLSLDEMREQLRFLDFYASNCPPDAPVPTTE